MLFFYLLFLVLCPGARVVEILLSLAGGLLLAVLPWPVLHGLAVAVGEIRPLLESLSLVDLEIGFLRGLTGAAAPLSSVIAALILFGDAVGLAGLLVSLLISGGIGFVPFFGIVGLPLTGGGFPDTPLRFVFFPLISVGLRRLSREFCRQQMVKVPGAAHMLF